MENSSFDQNIDAEWLPLMNMKTHYIHMEVNAIEKLIRQQFPSLDQMIYANHAAISPWPRVTTEAVTQFALENAESGPMHYGQWVLRETRLRQKIADMLNAGSGEDVALLQNTTEGICNVTNGVDWHRGDNVVMPAGEFLTNQLAWDALSSIGVEIRKINILDTPEPELALLNAIDDRTRVLNVSFVQWDSGFRLNLETLGKQMENSGVLFFVDAIQGFGALQIDVDRCNVDCLSAGSHKWQMGPEGMAVFYCNEPTRKLLRLSKHGWRMMDEPYRFEKTGRKPSASARRFETGSPNSLGQAALMASVSLLCELGMDVIEQKVLENTAFITGELQKLHGITLLSPAKPDHQSGIVSFAPLETDLNDLRRRLARSKVVVAIRGSAIRISPRSW